jgi:uncharacterized protein (DUF1697 family)
MSRLIALLRGINVGRNRRVTMADLRELLASLGYPDARTLLQSGNIVLTSKTSPERLRAELEEQIASRFGIDVPVVVRERDELAEVVELNPLRDVAVESKRYQVSFLSAEPHPDAVRELEAVDVAPERFVVIGREIYAWHPDGIHESKLAKLLTGKRLGVVATARNWNTVVKLLELADE